MSISPLAGKPAEPSILVDVSRLVTAYYMGSPDPSVPSQRVAFGTSGHRGSSFENAFNEAHILAITRPSACTGGSRRVDGPLYLGIATHALSTPAFASALEVLAANGVEMMIDPAAVTRRPRRIVRGCDDGEPAFAPAVVGEDRARDDRNAAAPSATRRTAARRIPK